MGILYKLPRRPGADGRVYFSRPEIRELLSLYTRRVVAGEWRDYAIDADRDRVVFSVFKHSLACPLYTIEKFSRGAGYRLCSRGRRLKQAKTITEVLAALDGRPRLVGRSDTCGETKARAHQ